MNRFAQGIHDRLFRSDVKRFVAQNRFTGDICSMDVLEAASDSSREQEAILQQEVLGQISDSSSDSSDDVKTEAIANQISIEVNAVLSREEQERSSTRVPLIDSNCQEIALRLKINGTSAK